MSKADRARQLLKEKLFAFELFKELSASLKDELVAVVEQVSYSPGTLLFSEGDPPEDIYLLVEGEVKCFNRVSDPEAEGEASPRRQSLSMKRPSIQGIEAVDFGQCVNVIHPGRAIGVVELMQNQPRSTTAACSQACEAIIIRKQDFLRLVKESMSRDWVEKDKFLQTHLVGIRDHARHFVPITGKSHATYMFVKRKYPGGHVFLREGNHVDGAIYVIHQGSVNFFRAAPGAPKAETSWRNPVMEKGKPLGLLQPTSAGVLAREYRWLGGVAREGCAPCCLVVSSAAPPLPAVWGRNPFLWSQEPSPELGEYSGNEWVWKGK
ncbi:Anthocyanidin 3-O-glucosyltransferase 2 [Durusdinium trenchii]|uniref:Anthocyanidin 3-O-glucosyltransferase 2 n=1 Tax=Durusdinium trenchii TaxID=1381693 RepID=A0ABP0HAP3_9DINO